MDWASTRLLSVSFRSAPAFNGRPVDRVCGYATSPQCDDSKCRRCVPINNEQVPLYKLLAYAYLGYRALANRVSRYRSTEMYQLVASISCTDIMIGRRLQLQRYQSYRRHCQRLPVGDRLYLRSHTLSLPKSLASEPPRGHHPSLPCDRQCSSSRVRCKEFLVSDERYWGFGRPRVGTAAASWAAVGR